MRRNSGEWCGCTRRRDSDLRRKDRGGDETGQGGLGTSPLRTALYDLNVELGGKMVPFAGYEMPVQFPLGVMKEHVACRSGAGLFDVSHMGQIVVTHPDGLDAAAAALERLVPQNVIGLAVGRQRYGLFLGDNGGILDDLMIARRAGDLFLVVNAACKDLIWRCCRRACRNAT